MRTGFVFTFINFFFWVCKKKAQEKGRKILIGKKWNQPKFASLVELFSVAGKTCSISLRSENICFSVKKGFHRHFCVRKKLFLVEKKSSPWECRYKIRTFSPNILCVQKVPRIWRKYIFVLSVLSRDYQELKVFVREGSNCPSVGK